MMRDVYIGTIIVDREVALYRFEASLDGSLAYASEQRIDSLMPAEVRPLGVANDTTSVASNQVITIQLLERLAERQAIERGLISCLWQDAVLVIESISVRRRSYYGRKRLLSG
nr:hypothetical protein CFP56_41496 [Quercus suber]